MALADQVAHHRLQWRDLQFLRPDGGAEGGKARSFRPAAIPKSFCMAGGIGAPACSRVCAACSPSRCGMRREQTLILVRDRFGKKPMHYAALPDGRLVFGSEIKSLLKASGPGSTRSIRKRWRISSPMAMCPIPRPSMPRSAKLPAAHALDRAPRPAIRDAALLESAGRFSRDEHCTDAKAEMVDALRHAVKLRLISDVEVGALLSGGVDSSAVVSLMAGLQSLADQHFLHRLQGEAITTKAPYAKAVSDALSHQPSQSDRGSRRISACCRDCPPFMTSRSATFPRFPTFAVCKLARQIGEGGA